MLNVNKNIRYEWAKNRTHGLWLNVEHEVSFIVISLLIETGMSKNIINNTLNQNALTHSKGSIDSCAHCTVGLQR